MTDFFIQDLNMLEIDRCGWIDFGSTILFNFLDIQGNNNGCVDEDEMREAINQIRNQC